jgi:hypothetical protein
VLFDRHLLFVDERPFKDSSGSGNITDSLAMVIILGDCVCVVAWWWHGCGLT